MNLLVTACADLGDGNYDTVRRIHDLCSVSFERNLEMDGHVALTGDVSGETRNERYGHMLADVFRAVRDLCRQGDDVLLADADTLCLKPTPWPESDGFRMFNLANAHVPYSAFPREAYMHSGVRLLPASLPDAIWAVGTQLVQRWDYGMWAYDQYVWNRMYWLQVGKHYEDAASYCDPRYCWCAQPQYDNLGVPKSEAYIVHYHETRGMEQCLRRMQRESPR